MKSKFRIPAVQMKHFMCHQEINSFHSQLQRVQTQIVIARPLTPYRTLTDPAMTSLAEQFKALHKSTKAKSDQQVVESLTLEDLETEKVSFGEAKKGVLFSKAFEDAHWTEFILSKYEKSTKPEHRMYVRYVELRLKALKKEPDNKDKPMASSAKMPIPRDVWEELQSTECEPVLMDTPWMMTEEMEDLRSSNRNLFQRMGQLETSMQEIVGYLQKMSVKAKEED